MSQANSAAPANAPQPVLSVFDTVMITVGIVIGAGIFKTPPLVAQFMGSTPAMFAAWVAGALLSFIGALTYAELASTFPSTGGDYNFLTRAFGRNFSFFFAWARVVVISTGSIALLGFALGDYLTRIVDLGEFSAAIYAAIAVCVLTLLNLSGLKQSARFQNVMTLLLIAGLVLVGTAALLIAPQTNVHAAPAEPQFGMLGAAMVFVLLTYGGWNDSAYVSAEIHGGRRAILRSLTFSILLISVLYLSFIAAVVHGLGLQGLKDSQALGADLMQAAFGPLGARLISIIVAISALTSMNGTMLVGARTNCAVGNDWPLFAFMSSWNPTRNTPFAGFLTQAAIALGLIVFGAFEQNGFAAMVQFTAPVFWFFFMMSGVALLVLRTKERHRPRPFAVPLYPLLPLIFVLTCAYLLYSSIAYARSQNASYVALWVMVAGAVVWLVARTQNGAQLGIEDRLAPSKSDFEKR
jgi:APA family basic amino acid/polyamine antiporter